MDGVGEDARGAWRFHPELADPVVERGRHGKRGLNGSRTISLLVALCTPGTEMKMASGHNGATTSLVIPLLSQFFFLCVLNTVRAQYAPEFPTQVRADA